MALISDRIKEALLKRNMSQAELVNRTGIGKSSISTYISGEYEPKQKNIYKIAKALNVSPEWLMGFDAPQENEKSIVSVERGEPTQNNIEAAKVALFGGAGNVTDEMWDEVVRFADYIKNKEANSNDNK